MKQRDSFSTQIFCTWCGTTGDRLTAPFLFKHHFTAERYPNFLEELLEDVPQGVWFQNDAAPELCRVRQILSQRF
jgi:hypothetical protein